jgi:hypothetical protein
MATARRSREKPTSAKRSGSKFFHTGQDGRKRVDEELEKSKRRGKGGRQPFRFYVPVGDVKQGIILDEEPSFFMYEHQAKNEQTGRWDKFIPCVAEHENCPACEALGQDGTYIMFLTILDLSEYEDRKGVVHEFSRKLLAVKPRQQSKFLRKFDREGTLRGAKFEFARDDDKSAAIGNDIEFVEFVDDEELENDYWTVYTDNAGKDHEENQAEPFDYLELFPEPTLELVEKMVGRRSSNAGSRESNRRALHDEEEESDGWEDDEEDAPWEEDKPARKGRASREEKPARRTTRAPRSRAAKEEPEVPEEEEEDELPPERPRRRKTVEREKPRATARRSIKG